MRRLLPLALICWLQACGGSDVSVDGAAIDGGADSSADASVHDGGGAVDGSVRDGGSTDATTSDAASADGGSIDSGLRDAGDGALDASTDGGADADAVAPFCVLGDDTCLDRLPIDGMTLPYYRSHSLRTANPAIRNVVLVVHGNARNVQDYFATMAGLGFANDPAHTLVLAPYFQAVPTDVASPCAGNVDTPAATDVYWSCNGWKDGNAGATGYPLRQATTTYSYVAIDALLVAAKAAFPNIVRVTIVGYSAGAQTVQRSIAGSTEEDRTPAITTRYVVASPSSYLYLDDARIKSDAVCPDAEGCMLDATSFTAPYTDAASCPTFDDFKYGLASRTGYLRSIAANSADPMKEAAARAMLRTRYVSRAVTYVVSKGDSTNTSFAGYGELDKGCEAMAEGPTGASYRLQRGLTFYTYATQVLGAAHRLSVVPACGHDQSCVFNGIATTELFDP
jgi:hypothetical protein